MNMIGKFLACAVMLASVASVSAADSGAGATMPIAGGTLYYEQIGSGTRPPLVLVNGGPGLDHSYMRATNVWDEIARTRPVVFYDQRGTGRSTSTVPANRYTLDMMVADLEALRVRLGAPRIALLGHSWGGVLVLAYATRFPQHVSRLVLVGSGSPNVTKHEFLFDKLYPEIAAKQVTDDSPAGRTGCKSDGLEDYERMSYYDQRNRPRVTVENESGFSEAVCTALVLDAMKIDLFPKLATLPVPTLVTNGRFDANVAPTVAYAISKAIPEAKLVYFEHSGHTPFEEEPDRFNLVVERFLDD